MSALLNASCLSSACPECGAAAGSECKDDRCVAVCHNSGWRDHCAALHVDRR